MESQNGYLSGSDLLAKELKDLVLEDGSKIQIRRLGLSDLAFVTENLPDVASLADAAKGSAAGLKTPAGRQAVGMIEKVIIAGVVQPKLFPDPTEGPTPRAFAQVDQLAIFNAILEHSGFTKEAASKVVPFSGSSA